MLTGFVPVFGDAGGIAEGSPLYCPAVQLAPVGALSYPSPARHVALAPLAADPPEVSVPNNLILYKAFHIIAQIYTANHAIFQIQIYTITAEICAKF